MRKRQGQMADPKHEDDVYQGPESEEGIHG